MDKRTQRRQARLEKRIWRVEQTGMGRGRPKMQAWEGSNLESTDCTERKCSNCGLGEHSTPIMRQGPQGPQSLCNTCGLQWSNQGRMGDGNVCDKESSDDVTIFEDMQAQLQTQLQAQLHLSDARGLKWQKIAEERSEKNKELQIEIECLNSKIKEIMDAKAAARYGPSELKLRTENQGLKEKNKELLQALDRVYKQCSASVETFTQVLQDTKCHQQQNNHHQASKRTGTSGKNGYESTGDVNVNIEQHQINGHPQHLGKNTPGSAPQVAADGGPDNSHLETIKKPVKVAKTRYDSKFDVPIDIGDQSCEEAVVLKNVAVAEDVCVKQVPLEENVLVKHVALGGPKIGGSREPMGSPAEDTPEALFTAVERKSALELVEQAFLVWLNSRIRRPTAKEMSFHKSQLSQKAWPAAGKETSFHWTGIPGSLLLDKFCEETDKPRPSCLALTDLLRTVLRIEGSKRTNDMLWCLVWTDCMTPEQLPGYVYNREDKRVRAAQLEDAIRSVKTRHS